MTQAQIADLAHRIAEALENENPTGAVFGETERAIIHETIERTVSK